jgi:methionyl-tRNA synthetase
MPNRVLVTAALTYANGPAHLGHVLEAIQTDVYVRARRMCGDEVIFMWADDTHGTPIQIRARRENIEPERLIARVYDEHLDVYRRFGFSHDIFYTTHSEENRKHAAAIFNALRERGDIEVREVDQLYSEVDQMFLADRMVSGICPVCKSPDQSGDSCEKCGATYRPTELIEPRSVISGDTPVLRSSSHLFVPLARHEAFLREWIKPVSEGGNTILQSTVRNFLTSWMDKGLQDWDISREAPYFGIEIPGFPGKFFYVWFDAPIGYIAATDKWCQNNGKDWRDWWRAAPGRGEDQTEIIHVIGKDIVYFHCLFWPAMLHAADYTVPSRVQVHGWLTVNGEKMSKRRGTFILGGTYLEHLDPMYLRYYLAAHLSATQDDIDLGMDDFLNRCNADLVGKAANLASRCIKFIHGQLGGRIGAIPTDAETKKLLDTARENFRDVPGLYCGFDSAKALRLAMEMVWDCDSYINERAPWKLAKQDPEGARNILTVGVEISKLVAAILKPVIPAWGEKMERMLRLQEPLDFDNATLPLPIDLELAPYETLAERIEKKTLDALIEASKEDVAADQAIGAEPVAAAVPAYEVEPLAEQTGIESLAKVDLRVGKIVACERVPKADKLLQLTVDLGPLGQRNVFSGIAKSYAPEQLLGKHVVVFANLAPRKMRFGISEGMIMAAGGSDDAVTVLELDPRSRPGDKIS